MHPASVAASARRRLNEKVLVHAYMPVVAPGRGRADITKLRNGPVPGYSNDVQIVQSREADVILEEMLHDARFAPPGRTIPSPAICSTAGR